MTHPDLALFAGLLPDPWERTHKRALRDWRQGDVLACPPLGWAASALDDDPITGVAIPETGIAHLQPTPTLAIVTSQTCDIEIDGPGERHPFVQISPVVEVPDISDERWSELTSWRMVDRVALTGQGLPSRCVADLRLSFPISKHLLVTAARLEGFSDERQRLEFGEHLAAKAGRPSLHDLLSVTVPKEINTAIQDARSQGTGWWAKVDEAVWLVEGDRLQPRAATLLLMVNNDLAPEELDRWVQLNRTFDGRAATAGISLKTPVVIPTKSLDVPTYKRSIPLNLPALKR